jgi:hypothetical protein
MGGPFAARERDAVSLLSLLAKIFGYGPAAPVAEELLDSAAREVRDLWLQGEPRPVPMPSAAVRHRDAQIASAAHAFRAPGRISDPMPPPCPASLPPSAPPEPLGPPPGPPVPAPPWHQASVEEPCRVPPPGWVCSRTAGHSGPCAARPAPGYGTSDVDYPPVTLPLTPSPLPPRPRPLSRTSSGPPPRMSPPPPRPPPPRPGHPRPPPARKR